MNKAAVIGAIIAIIIGIAIVSISMDSSTEDTDSISEEIVIEETIEEGIVIEETIEEGIVIEETIEEESEIDDEGRDLSVEFAESISLKGP